MLKNTLKIWKNKQKNQMLLVLKINYSKIELKVYMILLIKMKRHYKMF